MTKTLFLSFIMLSVTSFAQDSIRDREFTGKFSGGLGISFKDIGTGGQLNMGYSWLTKRNNLFLNAKVGHNLYLNYTRFHTPLESNIVPDNSALSLVNLCFDWSLIFQKTDRQHPLYRDSFEPSIGLCVGYHSTVYDGENFYNGVGQYFLGKSDGLHFGLIVTPISFYFPFVRSKHNALFLQTPIQFNAINFLKGGTPMPPLFCFSLGFKFG